MKIKKTKKKKQKTKKKTKKRQRNWKKVCTRGKMSERFDFRYFSRPGLQVGLNYPCKVFFSMYMYSFQASRCLANKRTIRTEYIYIYLILWTVTRQADRVVFQISLVTYQLHISAICFKQFTDNGRLIDKNKKKKKKAHEGGRVAVFTHSE